MKDNDLKDMGYRLHLEAHACQALRDRVRADCEFLVGIDSMDYSLLVGVADALSDRELQALGVREGPTDPESPTTPVRRKALYNAFPAADRRCVFFCAVIDVLQKYNAKKKVAHALKSVTVKSEDLSTVPSAAYARRFQDFIDGITDASDLAGLKYMESGGDLSADLNAPSSGSH